jgi:hypothetical protein
MAGSENSCVIWLLSLAIYIHLSVVFQLLELFRNFGEKSDILTIDDGRGHFSLALPYTSDMTSERGLCF